MQPGPALYSMRDLYPDVNTVLSTAEMGQTTETNDVHFVASGENTGQVVQPQDSFKTLVGIAMLIVILAVVTGVGV